MIMLLSIPMRQKCVIFRMMTVMNAQTVHDALMANTRLVALLGAVCVRQGLLMKMPILLHLAPLARRALQQVKRTWVPACLVELDNTQAIGQLSAQTAQLVRQTVMPTRPHLVQPARLVLLHHRAILDPAMPVQPGSTPMPQQLNVLIVVLERVTTTRRPIRRVRRVCPGSTQNLVSLAHAVSVLPDVTALYRVARVWTSAMRVWQGHMQTTALRHALSVLEVLQISIVILRQSVSNVPLARILAAVRQSATCVPRDRSTVTRIPQRPALCVLPDRRG